MTTNVYTAANMLVAANIAALQEYMDKLDTNKKIFEDCCKNLEITVKISKSKIEYFNKDGQLHRIDGPARIGYRENGNKSLEEWYNQGKLHNTDGPASIGYYENGNKSYEEWYNQGKRHNTDGPKIVTYWGNGNKSYEEW